MNRQYICTDVRFAALLAHMGYKFRVAKDPLGMQFLFEDSDITTSGVIEDYENGVQVASAKDLLLMYDTFLEQIQGKPTTKPSTPKIADPAPVVAIPGKEFYTRDMLATAALIAFGYPVLRVDPPDGQYRYPRFFFADDGSAMNRSRAVTAKIRAEMDRP